MMLLLLLLIDLFVSGCDHIFQSEHTQNVLHTNNKQQQTSPSMIPLNDLLIHTICGNNLLFLLLPHLIVVLIIDLIVWVSDFWVLIEVKWNETSLSLVTSLQLQVSQLIPLLLLNSELSNQSINSDWWQLYCPVTTVYCTVLYCVATQKEKE